MSTGKTGGNTSTVIMTKRAVRRRAAKLRAEENYWKSQNGPVIVRKLDTAETDQLATEAPSDK